MFPTDGQINKFPIRCPNVTIEQIWPRMDKECPRYCPTLTACSKWKQNLSWLVRLPKTLRLILRVFTIDLLPSQATHWYWVIQSPESRFGIKEFLWTFRALEYALHAMCHLRRKKQQTQGRKGQRVEVTQPVFYSREKVSAYADVRRRNFIPCKKPFFLRRLTVAIVNF